MTAVEEITYTVGILMSGRASDIVDPIGSNSPRAMNPEPSSQNRRGTE
jgi:hypothetical protein